MKKLLATLALVTAACAAPAFADVGISVRIGQPGFYGQLDIGDYGAPRLLYGQPVIVVDRYRHVAPIYLRVPRAHSRHWHRYCGRYDACARPVYFVRDEWYRDVYAPRYRQVHAREWRDDRRHDKRDHGRGRHDDRDDRRRSWR